MSNYINPYSEAEKLGWEQLILDEDLCYEFNILTFWRLPDGRVFMASDSGCSCPMPFEDYEGRTADEIIQKLEQVPTLAVAEQAIKGWNVNSYDEHLKVSAQEVRNALGILRTWFD